LGLTLFTELWNKNSQSQLLYIYQLSRSIYCFQVETDAYLELEHGELILSDLIIIIPARNEEYSLAKILPSIISSVTRSVIVVDNDSTDRTAEVAKSTGAVVVYQKRIGYGSACLAGIEYIKSLKEKPEIICFFDADGQSSVEDIGKVAKPVLAGRSQYCQGTRMKFQTSIRALSSMAQIANRFFSWFLSILWHQTISDLGPLRIMTWDALSKLNMRSPGYGWTIEMSTKILKAGVTHCEIPVSYKPRYSGRSKISGNLFIAIRAAFVMSLTLLHVMIFWRPVTDIK
jgi:glycosyltransferase involved in cell wall biosynthesis